MTNVFSIVDDDSDVDDLPPDDAPPVDDGAHRCRVCQTEVFRKGSRGRWPEYCDEHKPSRSGSRSSVKSVKNTPADAVKAAAVLGQVNGWIALGLMAAPEPYRFPMTASALAAKNEEFESQAAKALASDPALCKLLLKTGVMSGRAALLLAYGTLVGSLVPVAMMEYKDKGRG